MADHVSAAPVHELLPLPLDAMLAGDASSAVKWGLAADVVVPEEQELHKEDLELSSSLASLKEQEKDGAGEVAAPLDLERVKGLFTMRLSTTTRLFSTTFATLFVKNTADLADADEAPARSLFICRGGLNGAHYAIKVPVYRPPRPFQWNNLLDTTGRIYGDAEPVERHHESDKMIYHRIRDVWYREAGWRAWIPFWDVVDVREVQIRLESGSHGRYRVKMQKLNIPAIEATAKRIIAEGPDDEDWWQGNACDGDYDGDGKWRAYRHSKRCLEKMEASGADCEGKVIVDAEERLKRLESLDHFHVAFHDPGLASKELTLDGMAQDSCVYFESEIAQAEVGETYRALHLKDGWTVGKRYRQWFMSIFSVFMFILMTALVLSKPGLVAKLVAVILALGVIGLWKFVTGKWVVAASFGSVFIAALAYEVAPPLEAIIST